MKLKDGGSTSCKSMPHSGPGLLPHSCILRCSLHQRVLPHFAYFTGIVALQSSTLCHFSKCASQSWKVVQSDKTLSSQASDRTSASIPGKSLGSKILGQQCSKTLPSVLCGKSAWHFHSSSRLSLAFTNLQRSLACLRSCLLEHQHVGQSGIAHMTVQIASILAQMCRRSENKGFVAIWQTILDKSLENCVQYNSI